MGDSKNKEIGTQQQTEEERVKFSQKITGKRSFGRQSGKPVSTPEGTELFSGGLDTRGRKRRERKSKFFVGVRLSS